MTPDQRILLLKDEYLLLQKFYEDFDARIMTIKGWSATIAIAAIGSGFIYTRFLWLFAAGASLAFWIIETFWKFFQYQYAPRLEALEKAFRDDSFSDIPPLQIYTAWYASWTARRVSVRRVAFLGIVIFPHVLTAAVGVALFLCEMSGILVVARK